MIRSNNPGIDAAALEKRIEVELRQPEQPPAPWPSSSLSTGGAPILPAQGAGLKNLKLRLRGVPVLGKLLMELNRWQRRRRLVGRALSTPYLGYVLRWLKSLALIHESRGRMELTVRELSLTEQRLRTEIALSNLHLAELRERMEASRRELEFSEQRLNTAMELNLQHLSALRAEIAEEKKRSAANRSEIIFQQRRLTEVLESPARQASVAPGQENAASVVQGDELDSYYAAFEASFRGAREEIRARLSVYLDRVMACRGDLPVLDIGCGRGEWIELLGEQGITAYGVDLNSVFVADAQQRGLDARKAEAISHLRSLTDASLSGVTGFHIIEHLQIQDLVMVIDEANRVLTSGGFLLLETPNPENLLVGASSFWNDPTHRAPLPSSVMRFMLEQRGFPDPEVIYLHPADEKMKLRETGETSERLNQLLYGPMDYAIWARKA
ncbi:MAG: methyltransferase domain-containing protein [Pseudomonadota bacterium]